MSRNARTISPSNSTATSPATTTMTITVTPNLDSEDCSNCTNEAPKVLILKLERKKERQNGHITWSEDTIDNENLNKKKSNCKTKIRCRGLNILFFSMLHISSKWRC